MSDSEIFIDFASGYSRWERPYRGGLTLQMSMGVERMKIGERIKEVFDGMPKNCSINWLAAQLHCERRNIYRIFAKDNIDIQLLNRISRVLNHNFFADLSLTLEERLSKLDT